jgi:predicted ArsR family transcriptional regulator
MVRSLERIRILLKDKEMTIRQVAADSKVSYETAARHLRKLFDCGDLTKENYGKPHVLHYTGKFRQLKLYSWLSQ